MLTFLIPLLSLSFVDASNLPQKPLHRHDEGSNFIQSSIYGRTMDISSLPDPVILPPSYKPSEFDQADEFVAMGTFAHLPFIDCSVPESSGTFDIGIVGHPFDLGVSYRPGARFGPNGARQGARRISAAFGWE
jgi:agmatinase